MKINCYNMHTISCWGWWYVLLVGWAWEKGRGGILCMYITFVSSLIAYFFFPVLVVFLLGHISPSFFSYDNSYCNVNSRAYFTQFYRIYICMYAMSLCVCFMQFNHLSASCFQGSIYALPLLFFFLSLTLVNMS